MANLGGDPGDAGRYMNGDFEDDGGEHPRGCGAPDCDLPWVWREDEDGRPVLVPPCCWDCY